MQLQPGAYNLCQRTEFSADPNVPSPKVKFVNLPVDQTLGAVFLLLLIFPPFCLHLIFLTSSTSSYSSLSILGQLF